MSLETGEVSDQATRRDLLWEDGELTSGAALFQIERALEGAVLATGGEEVERLSPLGGEELRFEMSPGEWGYLRVISVGLGRIEVEWARATSEADTLERDPASLSISELDGFAELSWPAESGVAYLVERRRLGVDDHPRPLAHVAGDRVVDTDPLFGLVEYRVRRDEPGSFGVSRRVVRGAIEGPIELTVGARIDLLSGRTEGDSADVAVTRISSTTLGLRPVGDAMLSVLPRGGQVAWALPPIDTGQYMDRERMFSMDSVVSVYTNERVYARVTFEQLEGGRIALLREVETEGGTVLPLPPESPDYSYGQGELFCLLKPLATGRGGDVEARPVLEIEVGYGTERWTAVVEGAVGARQLSAAHEAAVGDPPICRVRLRHRLEGGIQSRPTEVQEVLLGDRSDPEQVRAWLDAAFFDLTHENYSRRVASRAVITHLGSEAAPRLQEAMNAEDPELATAAREILIAAAAADGGNVELLLRARAIGEGITSDPPAGILDSDPAVRAFTLLSSPPSDALRDWAYLLTSTDPEEGIATLARTFPLGDVPLGTPYALIPPEARPARVRPDWRNLVPELTPGEVVELARRSANLDDVRIARLAYRVAAEIERGSSQRTWDPGLRERVELALRMIDREEIGAMIPAASSLLRSPIADLESAETLIAERMRSPLEPEGRRQIHVDGSYDALVSALASLPDEAYVDLVLPPIEIHTESPSALLDITSTGVRLIGSPGTRLAFGVRVNEARDVVLQDLEIANLRGSALIVGGGVTALRCSLTGPQTTIVVQNGQLELDHCRISATTPRGMGWLTRMVLGGQLVARSCLFFGGSLATTANGEMVLHRCVLQAGARPAIQGQRGDQVQLIDCLVRGDAQGISGVSTGVAAGTLFDTASDPITTGGGMRVCPMSSAHTSRCPAFHQAAVLDKPVRER